MAHYAVLNENNKVIYVFVGKDENEDGIDWEEHYSEFYGGKTIKRTSYNTFGGQHLDGKTPFRKNYAGIGMTYDFERDAFIPESLSPHFILNEETCIWEPPVPKPNDDKYYVWNDELVNWVEAVEVENE